MKLVMNSFIAEAYVSKSQIARKLTESWMLTEGYCPSCSSSLKSSKANTKVLDFYCNNCTNEYELKSKKGSFTKKITDGAYESMIQRISEENSPHFFFLAYDASYRVNDLIAVPNYFFQEEVIERRNPLSSSAKRAGWVGCNILLNQIPSLGKVKLVENGKFVNPNTVIKIWQKTTFLKLDSYYDSRGWTLDVLNCIDMIGGRNFSLQQIYQFESYLSAKHPNNNHVKDKIRQQLQVLRDKGIIEFLSRGIYRVSQD
jgi:type II restriction enzyme